MLKLSGNFITKIPKCFRGPPEHSAIGNIHYIGMNCYIGYYYIATCHSKQLPVGLMVLSDGMDHFLKIKKHFNKSTNTKIYQKLKLICNAIQIKANG